MSAEGAGLAGVMTMTHSMTAIASDGPKSPFVFIKEGGNVKNKVFSASAGRKWVSLLTGAFRNNYVFS